MSPSSPAVPVPGSGTPAGRAPALDAVRGLALLGSAVGTALLWLGGRQLGAGYRPVEASGLDRAVDQVVALTVDNRVLAVFALLLGHGLVVQLDRARRSAAATAPADGGRPGTAEPEDSWAGAGVVLRRAGLLVAVGAVHAALVLEADVLATLGVLLVLSLPLARARTRTHVGVALLVLPPLLLHGVADGLGGSAGLPDPPTDYLLSVVDRVGTWLLGLVLLPFAQVGLALAVIAGIRLARAGWLLSPGQHRRPLLLVGAAASALGLLGAWPFARVLAAGPLVDVTVSVPAGVLSSLSGPAAALGAVCLAVVALDALPGAGLRLRDALALLGRRSLVVYLAHSVVLALVLAPWAGGAGGRWGSAAVCALGAGLWLVALLAALTSTGGTRTGRTGGAAEDGAGAQPTERQGRARSAAT